MAITTTFQNTFKLNVLKGGHQFGGTATNTYKMALYTSSATIDATTTAYSATNEIAGTGYSAGGGTLTVNALPSAASTVYVDFVDLAWTTATFTARGTLLYDTTPDNGATANGAVASWDFGADKTVSAGTFTIVFPTADTSNAIIRLS